MADVLSPRQQHVYRAIAFFITTYGYSPAVADICALTGIRSTKAVARHLQRLEAAHMIRRTPGRARSIVLGPTRRVPVLRYDPVLLRYAVGATSIPLTLLETRIVNVLRFYAGRVIHIRDLQVMLHGSEHVNASTDAAMRALLSSTRRKLAAAHPCGSNWIVCTYNVGYCWIEPS